MNDTTVQRLTCADVRGLLDLVAADELAGVDVEARYPALMAHFRRCDRCRTAYAMLCEALRWEEASPRLPTPTSPPRLSFLESEEGSPWRRLVEGGSSLFPLTFEIDRAFITRALRGPELAGVRGEPPRYGERHTLLLADWVTTERGDWIVELTAYRRADRPEALDLEARLVSDERLPARLSVVLSWADQRLSAPLDEAGTARFRDLPLSRLVETPSGEVKDDLTISFSRP